MERHILVLDDQMKHIEAMQAYAGITNRYLFVTEMHTALYVLYEYDVDRDLDLIACNAQLRTSDAFEFIKTVKHDPRLRGLPLICYSVTNNLALNAVRVVAETLGADEFIATMQFDGGAICDEIERWLKLRRKYNGWTEFPGFGDQPDAA